MHSSHFAAAMEMKVKVIVATEAVCMQEASGKAADMARMHSGVSSKECNWKGD